MKEGREEEGRRGEVECIPSHCRFYLPTLGADVDVSNYTSDRRIERRRRCADIKVEVAAEKEGARTEVNRRETGDGRERERERIYEVAGV